MANASRQFISPSGVYTGGYTSEVLQPTGLSTLSQQHNVQMTRGIFQVDLTSGTVDLEGRLHVDAPWLVLKSFSESAMYELVLANFLRISVSDAARCWLGEVR